MQALMPIESNGKLLLPGFRLKRLEMLNWGTFNGQVQRMQPDCPVATTKLPADDN